MCLIFISLQHHPTYKLIVAANRDEFYNRKTEAAHYWKDHPTLLGHDYFRKNKYAHQLS
jgi:uncharacterized protein with NRDE domain